MRACSSALLHPRPPPPHRSHPNPKNPTLTPQIEAFDRYASDEEDLGFNAEDEGAEEGAGEGEEGEEAWDAALDDFDEEQDEKVRGGLRVGGGLWSELSWV